jgi:hypothetical protein
MCIRTNPPKNSLVNRWFTLSSSDIDIQYCCCSRRRARERPQKTVGWIAPLRTARLFPAVPRPGDRGRRKGITRS